MSVDTLRKAISDRVTANWTVTSLNRVVHGDNRPPLNTEDGTWIRVSFNIIKKENASVGTDFQRSRGFINFQIFTLPKIGDKTALSIVDHVESIFQNANFNGVRCYACQPISVGERENSYQLNARVEFEYDVFS